jgi:subtilisin family serine protease
MRVLLSALAVAAAAAPAAAATPMLVQVRPAAAPWLRAAGAERVAAGLGVWRTSSRPLVARLRAAGLLRAAEPERPLVRLQEGSVFSDPFVDREWWLSTIGIEGLTPPGPGKAVTIVDSGIDVDHPEFAGRPNLVVLNQQTTFARDEDHGTEVSSVVGAPTNGVGIVGVYPQAVLRIWDASPFRSITNSEAIAGIERAAADGPGVINLSWGSAERDPLLEEAIANAVRSGSLVVAASGNERGAGSPLIYPASLPHVLTVGATDQQGRITDFSSASPGLDLVAPGLDIAVADPEAFSGYSLVDGTSFSAPIVSGAAAWVWTTRPELDATQLFEVLRSSARDVAAPGWDHDSGFGLLDVGAALAAPAPAPDPQEPNDDVSLIVAGAAFSTGSPLLTVPGRLAASLDGVDDPRDVYRLRVAAHRRIRVTARAADGRPLTVSLWNRATRSVVRSASGLVNRGANTASAGTGARAFSGYVSVGVAPGRRTTYTLSVTTSAAR